MQVESSYQQCESFGMRAWIRPREFLVSVYILVTSHLFFLWLLLCAGQTSPCRVAPGNPVHVARQQKLPHAVSVALLPLLACSQSPRPPRHLFLVLRKPASSIVGVVYQCCEMAP